MVQVGSVFPSIDRFRWEREMEARVRPRARVIGRAMPLANSRGHEIMDPSVAALLGMMAGRRSDGAVGRRGPGMTGR